METKNLLKSLKRRLSWMLCLVALLAVGQSAFCAATMNKRYYYIKTTAKWEENSPCSKIEFNSWDNCGGTTFNATTATKCGDNLYYIYVPNKQQDAYAVKALRYASDCSSWWSSTNCINNNNNQNNTCIDISGDTFQSSSLNLAPKHMYITGGATTSGNWDAYDFEPMIKQTDGSYKQKLGDLTTSDKEFKINAYNYWDGNNTTWWNNATIKTASCVGVTLTKDGNAKIKLKTGYKNPVYVYEKDNGSSHEIWAIATSACTTPETPTLTADASTVCVNTTPTFKSTSVTGASYQLYTSAGAVSGSPVTGTGNQISLTAAAINSNTTFYVKACSTASGCTSSCSQSDNVEISTTSTPTAPGADYKITYTGTLMDGETITLTAPTSGWGGGAPTHYEWFVNDVSKGESAGLSYQYTISGTNNFGVRVFGINDCGKSAGSSVSTSFTNIKPRCTNPTAQNVSLSGCSVVAMTGSESGYTYTLYKGGVEVAGSDWAGDGNAHSWSVTTTGTYTIKAKDTETGGCLTAMSGSANVTKLGPVVTPSLSLSNIHPYEVLTLTADKDVSWSLSPASETAYISTESGSSTIFKGAVGTYTITASANGCDTATNFTVKIDENKCN